LDNKIKVEETSQGRKYSSKDFETPAYKEKNFYQTTIPYWSKNTSKTRIEAEAV